MGLFSSILGGKAPSYNAPAAQTYMTGEQGMTGAYNWLNSNGYSNQLNAQSNALGNISTPEKATAYYSAYQPTSFENALANQSFQNVWPNTQNYMQSQLAKSGMSYSPVAAATLGQAYGNIATNIGQYLSNQANTRATNDLQSNLSINPMSYINPVAQNYYNQSNMQNDANYKAALNQAQADYANSMAKYQSKNSMIDALGGLALGGIGAGFGAAGMLGGTGGLSGAMTGFNLGQGINSGNMTGALTGLALNNIGGMFANGGTSNFGNMASQYNSSNLPTSSFVNGPMRVTGWSG